MGLAMTNYERCYECTGYGDDWVWDPETQDYVIACVTCPYNGDDDVDVVRAEDHQD